MNLDLYVFNLLNGLAGKWLILDYLGIFVAKYLGYFLLIFLIILLLKDFKKYWQMVLEALLVAFFVRFFLVEIIRFLWFRSRPFVENQVNLLLVNYNPNESSFPSGHASFYFALSTVIYIYNKKFGIIFYIGSALIVIARVFVGVHYPADILFGALLGILIGFILNKFFRKIYLKYNF